ncbi:MAG: UpxY family transcription antiterminator [Candidatus Omnitrophica bacterium]|nr:UpxY family transcription antiterminator [Candidatus Omnitrophota bacterium]
MSYKDSHSWYPLYTRSRHEKFVETELLEKGIEAFTPKVTYRRKWSDRIKYIKEPLFKSYCFAKFSLFNKTEILSQAGIVSVVHFQSKYVPVPEKIIQSLRIITETNYQANPCPYLNKGDYVYIKKGPLKGVEGFILEKRNNNTSVVISVDALASAIKCVVGIDCVEFS